MNGDVKNLKCVVGSYMWCEADLFSKFFCFVLFFLAVGPITKDRHPVLRN